MLPKLTLRNASSEIASKFNLSRLTWSALWQFCFAADFTIQFLPVKKWSQTERWDLLTPTARPFQSFHSLPKWACQSKSSSFPLKQSMLARKRQTLSLSLSSQSSLSPPPTVTLSKKSNSLCLTAWHSSVCQQSSKSVLSSLLSSQYSFKSTKTKSSSFPNTF